MNPDLDRLQPYPFAKIKLLLADLPAAAVSPIQLSIGEPKHAAPDFVLEAISESLRGLETYPTTPGSPELREAIARWLQRRYGLSSISPDSEVIAVNGTREALFAIAQCVLDRSSNRRQVMTPNPFYQIYEGAALLAGLEPEYYDASSTTKEPDFSAIPEASWAATQLLYLCNPGNPTGSTLKLETLQQLIALAQRHQFTIVSDECYSEIYRESSGPPPGLLQAAHSMGNTDYRHCLVFHSLSKRSNLPGLRSGFVAGDARLIKSFTLYRTYHGCSMSPPVQKASIAAWGDEQHVIDNRKAYDEKYQAVLEILQPSLDLELPDAGFYLWPRLPVSDEIFTQDMHRLHNVAVVPGSYLAREVNGVNPGNRRTRLALVATLDDCIEAATRIRDYLQTLEN